MRGVSTLCLNTFSGFGGFISLCDVVHLGDGRTLLEQYQGAQVSFISISKHNYLISLSILCWVSRGATLC